MARGISEGRPQGIFHARVPIVKFVDAKTGDQSLSWHIQAGVLAIARNRLRLFVRPLKIVPMPDASNQKSVAADVNASAQKKQAISPMPS